MPRNIYISRTEAELLVDLIEEHALHDGILLMLSDELRKEFGMCERDKNQITHKYVDEST